MTTTAAKVTAITDPQLAGTTGRLTATITQEDGVTGFKPTTLTLTIVEKVNQTVVLAVTDILTYCNSSGALSLELTPAMRTLVDSGVTGGVEIHQAILEWTWQSATRKGAAIVEYALQRNANV